MKLSIALLLFLLVAPAWAQSTPKDKRFFLGGAGATRCDKWLEVREEKVSALAFALESWLLGYVSGSVPPDDQGYFLSFYTEDDVFSRVNFYCREHKSNILFQAAAVASADLIRTNASRIRKHLNEHKP